MYYESFRERIHHYLSTMAIAKKFYDDGLLTKNEYYYEEKIRFKVNPLFVINFFVSGIPLGFIITWVYLASDRSILACMIFHLFVNFMQEKNAMTPTTKCVETIIVTLFAIIIVITNRKMFFSKDHIGNILNG